MKMPRILTAILLSAVLMSAFSGCGSEPVDPAADAAAQNRQYMATLNQQMTDLQTTIDDFNTAVAADDLVGMNAQLTAAGKILDQVKATEPTDALKDAHDGYIDGLDTLYGAMGDYVTLYTGLSDGSIDTESFNKGIADVQKAYDEGVDAIEAADKLVVDSGSGDGTQAAQ